ncbi:MAG: DUF2892 domain-containing protein [Pseudomonadota bacterium]
MTLKAMFMKRNVGGIDRIVRILPAVVVAVLWAQGVIGGPVAVALGLLAGMLLLTAVTGACSIYYMLGLSTCSAKTEAPVDRA